MNCKYPACKYQVWTYGTDYCQPHAIQMYLDAKEVEHPPVSYKEYLGSQEWRQVAAGVKWAAGACCQVCGRPETEVTLHAHHNNYKRVGHERPSDLLCACSECHKLFSMWYRYDRELGYHVPK